MKAIINVNTKKVTGINRKPGPFEVELNMLNINVTKTMDEQEYSLSKHPGFFNIDDLIQAKGKKILSDSFRKYIILNEELAEDDISINLASHSADTGFKFLQLHPQGQCRTNKINLPMTTSSIGLYIESDSGISVEIGTNASTFNAIKNGEFIDLKESTNSIYLKFKNNSDEYKKIYSYGILV